MSYTVGTWPTLAMSHFGFLESVGMSWETIVQAWSTCGTSSDSIHMFVFQDVKNMLPVTYKN
jgi:hypothetical protein